LARYDGAAAGMLIVIDEQGNVPRADYPHWAGADSAASALGAARKSRGSPARATTGPPPPARAPSPSRSAPRNRDPPRRPRDARARLGLRGARGVAASNGRRRPGSDRARREAERRAHPPHADPRRARQRAGIVERSHPRPPEPAGPQPLAAPRRAAPRPRLAA